LLIHSYGNKQFLLLFLTQTGQDLHLSDWWW